MTIGKILLTQRANEVRKSLVFMIFKNWLCHGTQASERWYQNIQTQFWICLESEEFFLTKNFGNRQKISFRPTGVILVYFFLVAVYMTHHFYVVIMVYVQPYTCIIPFFVVAALSLSHQLKKVIFKYLNTCLFEVKRKYIK